MLIFKENWTFKTDSKMQANIKLHLGKLSLLLLPIMLIGNEVWEGKPKDLTPWGWFFLFSLFSSLGIIIFLMASKNSQVQVSNFLRIHGDLSERHFNHRVLFWVSCRAKVPSIVRCVKCNNLSTLRWVNLCLLQNLLNA